MHQCAWDFLLASVQILPFLSLTLNVSNSLILGFTWLFMQILKLQDVPQCFLTLSHDRTVRFWDLRLPHQLGRTTPLCGRSCFHEDLSRAPSAFSTLSLLAPKLAFDFPVTAGDVHPLNGSRSIALATADGFVRLFDLRQLFSRGRLQLSLIHFSLFRVKLLFLHPFFNFFHRHLFIIFVAIFISCAYFEHLARTLFIIRTTFFYSPPFIFA